MYSVFDNFGFLRILQDFTAPRQREISQTLFIKFYILIEYLVPGIQGVLTTDLVMALFFDGSLFS